MNKYIFFIAIIYCNAASSMEITAQNARDEDTPQIISFLLALKTKIANNESLTSIRTFATDHKNIIGPSLLSPLSTVHGYSEELEYLLQKDIDVNEPNDTYPTAIFSAIIARNLPAVQVLLKHQANIHLENNYNVKCTGSNPLLCAVHKYPLTQEDIEIAAALLNHTNGKQLVNKQGKTSNGKKYTPLHVLAIHATKEISFDVCQLCNLTSECSADTVKAEHLQFATQLMDILLQKGANPSIQDENNESAIDLVRNAGLTDLAQQMQERHALLIHHN